MNILVLNGSPKREHSDTLRITRAFLDGMQDAAAQEIGTPMIPEEQYAAILNGGV